MRALRKRALQRARVRTHTDRHAKVAAVVKLRLSVHHLLGGWRQSVVANLDQVVIAGHAVEHLAAGGQLEKLQHPIGQFDRQPTAGRGDVGVHRLDGPQQRAIKSGIGACQSVAPAHHDVQPQHGQQARHEQHQQGPPQAPVRPANHAKRRMVSGRVARPVPLCRVHHRRTPAHTPGRAGWQSARRCPPAACAGGE